MPNNCDLIIIPLIIGYLLDLIGGDPRWLPHPIVGFGNTISFLERRLNKDPYRRLKGVLMAWGLSVLTGLLFVGLAVLTLSMGEWCYLIVASIIVFYGLANRSLITEGGEVIKVLETQGLEAGRKRLSWIVGRDTSQLSRQEIYTAVLETRSENLSDGVVAPLFYYAIAGLPGLMVYKMVNTMDSMVGYKDARYLKYGCCAARMDDVLNYIPARLTALLMAIISGRRTVFAFIYHYRHQHASPNSGYPESAMAGILNCRFGGAHLYYGLLVEKPYIGECNRELHYADFRRAVTINHSVTLITVFLIILGWGIACYMPPSA